MWKVQLCELNYDCEEEQAVSEVIKGGWLTAGEQTLTFENEFGNFLGGNVTCVAVSSCTAALHMALLAGGVGVEDEVIISALTFVADANVVELVGAKPVLADVTSKDDWNMSFESFKKVISEKTKAVILVHFAGYPCVDIFKIVDYCNEHNILCIEDVAHAPGASINGMKCGTIADIGCFSFFSNKNLAVGEGGLLSTKKEDIAKKLPLMRSHGMTSVTLDRHLGRTATYDVEFPGLNYRFDEIRAALARVQLRKLSNGNIRRKSLVTEYCRKIPEEFHIPFKNHMSDAEASYHIMPILLPEKMDRLKVMKLMKQRGIQTSIHYPAIWDFTAYHDKMKCSECGITKSIIRNELTLPLHPKMTFEDIDYVSNNLKELVNVA